jgi:hypothetical protein
VKTLSFVMAGLDPAIHVLVSAKKKRKTWITGTSPVMTELTGNGGARLRMLR